jgi:hypothetical protein
MTNAAAAAGVAAPSPSFSLTPLHLQEEEDQEDGGIEEEEELEEEDDIVGEPRDDSESPISDIEIAA